MGCWLTGTLMENEDKRTGREGKRKNKEKRKQKKILLERTGDLKTRLKTPTYGRIFWQIRMDGEIKTNDTL